MRKLFVLFTFLSLSIILFACDANKSEGEILEEISKAILMADYGGLKSGDIVDGNLNLPLKYKDVEISWTSTSPEIIDGFGNLTRPSECWIESRDQQGEEVFTGLNDLWPVVLEGRYKYLGMEDTHKIIIRVRPSEGYTCNKYKG